MHKYNICMRLIGRNILRENLVICETENKELTDDHRI